MMVDEPKGGDYDTGFHRCAEGWRLYIDFLYAKPSDTREAFYAYRQHVITCPECIAMEGRFAEEVEG